MHVHTVCCLAFEMIGIYKSLAPIIKEKVLTMLGNSFTSDNDPENAWVQGEILSSGIT